MTSSAPRSQHGERPESERDVSRHRDPPAVGALAASVEGGVAQGRYQHPSDGRRDREHGFPSVRELTDEELALDLQADGEEENRHEAIVDPVTQVELQHPLAQRQAQRHVQHLFVRDRPRGVGPHESADGADEQEKRARRLPSCELMKRAQHALAGALGVRPGVQLVITNDRVETHAVLMSVEVVTPRPSDCRGHGRDSARCAVATDVPAHRNVDRTAAATVEEIHKRTAVGRVFQLR